MRKSYYWVVELLVITFFIVFQISAIATLQKEKEKKKAEAFKKGEK